MKISYNWLKWYVPELPKPEALKDIFTYHLTEVEGIETLPDGDTIFDLNILPNRAHDLLSHKGVALEVSGQLGLGFVEPKSHYDEILSKKTITKTDLKIESQTQNCRRYSARIIRNIKVGPSPDWVVKHLESIGQRSINNIVDATNLLMHNCGQPAHAFDLKNFPDNKLIVTSAENDEELELVGRDKIIAKLKETDLVIRNGSGINLALAGIKGGAHSGIQDDTTDIVLEVANFDPVSIRKTARRIGVLSDAAKRFENDLTTELCSYGMLELTALISEMCPDCIMEEVVDYYPNPQEEKTIEFSVDFINKKLGSDISENDIEKILKNYKFEYSIKDSVFKITVPVFRLDLIYPEDIVEEIGRIYGYDKIKPVLQKINFKPEINKEYNKIEEIRKDLLSKGYREVITYSFVKNGDIQVARGLKGKDYLRTNLSDGLKQSYELNKNNISLLGIDEVNIFEIGTVFTKDSEELHVAYNEKNTIKEYKINEFISPQVPTRDMLSTHNSIFKSWSTFPSITRDISVWAGEETNEEILKKLYIENGTELLVTEPRMVDKFQKDGRTSYAFRLVFQAQDRTLTDDEISEIMENIIHKLSNIPNIEIR